MPRNGLAIDARQPARNLTLGQALAVQRTDEVDHGHYEQSRFDMTRLHKNGATLGAYLSNLHLLKSKWLVFNFLMRPLLAGWIAPADTSG